MSRSEALFERAKHTIPGGVNSPVRAFKAVGGTPRFMERAEGAYLFDADGKRTDWPRISVKLNGVLIHDDVELKKDFTTAAPLSKPLESPEGPIFLQDHGNPVFFRNIWVLPRK